MEIDRCSVCCNLSIYRETAVRQSNNQRSRATLQEASASGPRDARRVISASWHNERAEAMSVGASRHARYMYMYLGAGQVRPSEDHRTLSAAWAMAVKVLLRTLRTTTRALHTCSFAAPQSVSQSVSQGLLGSVVPFEGTRQGPIVGYVLQLAAPTGPSP